MSLRASPSPENAEGGTQSRQRSPSPALINLLEAAEDAACSFQCDARPALRPLVLSALSEAAAPTTPDNAPAAVDDLKQVVLSLGWDPNTLDFSRPLDARDFIHRLKAACLSNLHLAGEGSYSMVFRALNTLDGKQVTLKKLRMDSSADGLSPTAVREISLLKELSSCPHVVRMLDVMYDRTASSSNPSAPPRVWLVLEHLDMDLAEYTKRSPTPLQPTFIRSIFHQLLLALEAVHAHRVIHRDVKPQNILIDRHKQEIKLADFGLSRTCLPAPCGPRAMTQEVVTLLYRAPEVLLGSTKYSFPIDLWSAGCVLAELVIRNPLFKGDSEVRRYFYSEIVFSSIINWGKSEVWAPFFN
jgi:Protein kinase domain